MNGGDLAGSSCTLLQDIRLERLRKNMKTSVRIAGNPIDIRTRYISGTNVEQTSGQVHVAATLSLGNETQYLLDRRLGGWSESTGEEKNLPCWELNPGCTDRSLVSSDSGVSVLLFFRNIFICQGEADKTTNPIDTNVFWFL
jgi:hypothetical protein